MDNLKIEAKNEYLLAPMHAIEFYKELCRISNFDNWIWLTKPTPVLSNDEYESIFSEAAKLKQQIDAATQLVAQRAVLIGVNTMYLRRDGKVAAYNATSQHDADQILETCELITFEEYEQAVLNEQ